MTEIRNTFVKRRMNAGMTRTEFAASTGIPWERITAIEDERAEPTPTEIAAVQAFVDRLASSDDAPE